MKYPIVLIFFAFFIGSIRTQIVGGEDANIKDFPHMVSMRLNRRHFCGACIISDIHLLTAAHCVDKLIPPYDDVSVHTGSTRSKGTSDDSHHRIINVFIHSGWNDDPDLSFIHDIAVVKLAKKIKFNNMQKMIKLTREPPCSGTDAVITGWGYTTPAKKAEMSDTLKKLRLTLLSNTDCEIDHSIGKVYATQLCAYYHKGHGSCFGDSGSPLINDLNELVGILSWSHEVDCDAGQPEVYSNVYAYRDFIENAMLYM